MNGRPAEPTPGTPADADISRGRPGSTAGGRPMAVENRGQALLAHLRTPLYRTAYALILSNGATSVLGLAYWALAAHFYATRTVGINSAAISAVLLLSGIAQLNLEGALLRFIPAVGRAARSLIGYSYLACLVVSAVAASIFLAGLDIWSPALGFLRANAWTILWFVLATMGWSVFALQDMVLTGLRGASWVPVENTLFAVVKMVLLVVFAAPLPQYGIFASWTIPTALSVLPVNALIVGRLLPRHITESAARAIPIRPREIVRYVAGDYAGALFFLASTTLLPIVVTREVGSTANAYFYLSWLIAYSLQLVSLSMTSSLTVEAAASEGDLWGITRRALVQNARLVVPAALVIAAAAPLILRVYGPTYAARGDMLLRLLALSAIPGIITTLFMGVARVRRRTSRILLVQGLIAVLVLGLSVAWLRPFGITGIGMAWLVAQTAVAIPLLLGPLRPLLPGGSHPVG
ncbi:MAG: teichoic acid transporter [Chloroflexi bacterium]|nr:teichoic acid transporter [Chloroflexota bacterium]